MKHSKEEIASSDAPWSSEKIRILLEGEAEVTAQDDAGQNFDLLAEGMTLYEMRCAALDGGNVELIIEPAQFDVAARSIADDNVRSMLMLKARTGADPDIMAGLLGDPRAGTHLIRRGIELVRRQERTRHNKRLLDGLAGDKPLCWRCRKETVIKAGDHCGCEKPSPKYAPLTGPKTPYDPTMRPSPEEMSDEERLGEIALLANTQKNAPIPGGAYARKKVVPYGSHPQEITAQGTRWAPLSADLPAVGKKANNVWEDR